MKINQLTPSEEQLMQILWKLDSAYMKEVMANYPEPKPHQNTVSTFIKILVQKEFLTTEKEGRIFKYKVAVPYEDYRRFLLQNFLTDYFNDSGTEMLRMLIEDKIINTSDLRQFFEIKTILNPIAEQEKTENPLGEFLAELTSDKKGKKKDKKKKAKKKKLKE
ncbi:BlaI/MecI/CopY family transcriptional regulator [Kaistella palustris]|uniref:BlaI/MecI/CopY family transcriptional regulator n=1 Tax=Kaistella palustris TaxID=493376 RepID=UPI00041CA4E3|nr:BlaI/MecI/CopY family transcriptional regulator [Kaistella palustris]